MTRHATKGVTGNNLVGNWQAGGDPREKKNCLYWGSGGSTLKGITLMFLNVIKVIARERQKGEL